MEREMAAVLGPAADEMRHQNTWSRGKEVLR
jgi:hypothetical protein